MTPKEKAKELITKFNNSYFEKEEKYVIYQNIEESKRCALIAVDEIINEYNRLEAYKFIIEKEYWEEVKQEIEKL